jgi:hypothetical protein
MTRNPNGGSRHLRWHGLSHAAVISYDCAFELRPGLTARSRDIDKLRIAHRSTAAPTLGVSPKPDLV